MTASQPPLEPDPKPAWFPPDVAGADDDASDAVPLSPVLSVSPVRRARPSSRLVNVVLGLAAAVAVGGIAFAAGRMTAPVAAAGAQDGNGRQFFGNGQFPGGFGGGNGANGGGGAGGFGGFLRGGGAGALQGTIVAVSADSLTLRFGSGANGGQAIEVQIPLSTSTTVHQETGASNADLATGQTVLVQLGTPVAGATPGPTASGAPRQVQTPAANVIILTP